jgi:hypothetical protein
MAKFSEAFLQSMTQPAYQEGLFTAARNLGGLPGRIREEQETRATQESLVNMMNTNSRIAETGNVKGLEDQRVRLTEMLSAAQSDQSRDMILQELSRVEGLRDVAKPAAQQRDINTLLRAEQSLAEADKQISTLQGDASAEGQIKLDAAIRAKQAIQSRVDSLKSNASLVTAADNQKIDMEIASLTKDEALRSARKNEMIAKLKSVPVNSEAWNALVEEAENKNLGSAVNSVITELNDLELKRLEVAKAQEDQRKLTNEEIAELAEAKVPLSRGLSDIERRRRYTVFANAQIEKSVNKATRLLDVPSEAKANALIKTTLNFMVRDAELEGYPLMQDLSDKLESLLKDPEEIEIIQGLVADLTGSEIIPAVESYIKDRFPKRYSEYQQFRKTRIEEAEDYNIILEAIYKDDPSLNRNDPTGVDQARAEMRAEQKIAEIIREVQGSKRDPDLIQDAKLQSLMLPR